MYLVSQRKQRSVKCDDCAWIAWAVLPYWAKEQAGVERLVLSCSEEQEAIRFFLYKTVGYVGCELFGNSVFQSLSRVFVWEKEETSVSF